MLVVGGLAPLAYILVLIAMQHSPTSYVSPARELSMLVGAFFGAQLLGEGEVRRRITFASVIAVGVLLIALGSGASGLQRGIVSDARSYFALKNWNLRTGRRCRVRSNVTWPIGRSLSTRSC